MIPFIILAIENDDDRAFMERLYLDYNNLMYFEAKKVVESQWDAEEVVHSTVEKLIHKIDKLKEFDHKRRINYVITSIKNTALTYIHRDDKLFFVESYDELEGQQDENFDLAEMLADEETADILYEAWQKLSVKRQWILNCKYVLEMSNDEIAKSAGIKTDCVRMLLTRAKNDLRREFFKIYDK